MIDRDAIELTRELIHIAQRAGVDLDADLARDMIALQDRAAKGEDVETELRVVRASIGNRNRGAAREIADAMIAFGVRVGTGWSHGLILRMLGLPA